MDQHNTPLKQVIIAVRNFLADRFSLHEDSANHVEITDSIRRNVEFKGSNLWALIFAIFIASIGLNVNSTAVVIGAMLISPIMGPIMGIGVGMGINDIDLIRRGVKNLAIAALISVVVSSFYFFITPLHNAQSELLARTTPSIWDVFIAFFGGLAGIVGGTRREKSNVIPGVAIATALMPPLCTAGFGLAIGNWYYFLGAVYLFFINSVFICLASYIITRYLRLPKTHFEDQSREKKVMKYILYAVTITALPSVYLAYKIVDRSIFESNAQQFVANEFKFKNTHVIDRSFRYENGKKEIDLLLIGEDLSPETIAGLRKKLPDYNITKGKLSISQGLNAKQQFDFSKIKASILEDVFTKFGDKGPNNNKEEDGRNASVVPRQKDVEGELKALYPNLRAYSISRAVTYSMDTTLSDTSLLFVGNFAKDISADDKSKLRNWLKSRYKSDTITMFIQLPAEKKHNSRNRHSRR
jgi:uncharacterized hydrophobic protein (TIGR00271 family)